MHNIPSLNLERAIAQAKVARKKLPVPDNAVEPDKIGMQASALTRQAINLMIQARDLIRERDGQEP